MEFFVLANMFTIFTFDESLNVFRTTFLWIRMGGKWLQSGKWWDRMVSMWEKVGIV